MKKAGVLLVASLLLLSTIMGCGRTAGQSPTEGPTVTVETPSSGAPITDFVDAETAHFLKNGDPADVIYVEYGRYGVDGLTIMSSEEAAVVYEVFEGLNQLIVTEKVLEEATDADEYFSLKTTDAVYTVWFNMGNLTVGQDHFRVKHHESLWLALSDMTVAE
ncbi:MAG: hypothetical protein Q4B73_09140 [Lachnospiraceae bacterium]|nr:hypothetical protein [Lachnospiraceae bacterium]